MEKYNFKIPPGQPSAPMDISCLMELDFPIYLIGFMQHAHLFGTVISGYKYNPDTKEYIEVAKGSPKWPLTFYPTNEDYVVNPGDYLVARCTYNTTGKDEAVEYGSGNDHEMCGLVLLYYVYGNEAYSMLDQCSGDSYPKISSGLPESSKQPPPHNRRLEDKAGAETESER